MKEGAETKAAADLSDDALQSSSGGLSPPEIIEEPHLAGDGAVSPGIIGDGASPLPFLGWSRQSSLSSSLDSSSFCSDVEQDCRPRHPQSELDEIPSRRWFSPHHWFSPRRMPLVRATHRPESGELEQIFNEHVGQKVPMKVHMTNEKMRVEAMKAAFDGAGATRSVAEEKRRNSYERGLRIRQKVLIRVQMEDAKKRFKALTHLKGFSGVLSAAIEGADKNQIVIICNGVDPITLTTLLRKNMGFAELISVLAIEEKKPGGYVPEVRDRYQDNRRII